MRAEVATSGGLIINADDLGIHPWINAGIVEELAEKYGVKRVRVCQEPLFAFALTTGLAHNLNRLNPAKLALLRLR
jgi:hypothetical protein